MGSYTAELRDCLYLNFAVQAPEVERLLPPGVTLDSRQHHGKTWGFFSVLLYRCSGLYSRGLGWPNLKFKSAETRVYIVDGDKTPAVYQLRCYLPFFVSWFFNIFAGLPVRRMDLNYPTRVRPGGVFRWSLEGKGAGNIKGKISKNHGEQNNQLFDYFSSPSRAYDFFERRPVVYYGASDESVQRLKISGSYGKHFPVCIEEWELGFTAQDLERHQFPEAVSGCYFNPEVELGIEGPEEVSIDRLLFD